MEQDQDREFYVALGSHLELMGNAKVDAKLIAEVLRSGDLRPLLGAADSQTSTREKTEQERAAELEASGWTCSPPRDTLVATHWEERELGQQWVRFWGGTTALAAVVQPERTWPSRERGGWEFRVRLFGARVSMETGTSAGSGATAVEAMRKADERLQALLDDARRRRLRIKPS
jgi:hypothetical protein